MMQDNCPPELRARPYIGPGENDEQVVTIPVGAAGTSVIDFRVDLANPATSIYMPSFSGMFTPEVGFSFQPAGVDLNNAASLLANGSGELIALNTLVSFTFEPFKTIYVSVKGQGAGGTLTLVFINGLLFHSASS